MERNENKKRLFKDKKITVIAIITVVLLICVTVVAVIVPLLVEERVQDLIATNMEDIKTLKADITSEATSSSGHTFELYDSYEVFSGIVLTTKSYYFSYNWTTFTFNSQTDRDTVYNVMSSDYRCVGLYGPNPGGGWQTIYFGGVSSVSKDSNNVKVLNFTPRRNGVQ